MNKRTITEPIDSYLKAIIDRVSWDLFELSTNNRQLKKQETPHPTSTPPQTDSGVSVPLISIGPSGRGGYCQRGETWLTK